MELKCMENLVFDPSMRATKVVKKVVFQVGPDEDNVSTYLLHTTSLYASVRC